jgi:hypothetical protein
LLLPAMAFNYFFREALCAFYISSPPALLQQKFLQNRRINYFLIGILPFFDETN